MENLQATQAIGTNGFPQEQPEYRFVYTRTEIRKIIFCWFLLVLALLMPHVLLSDMGFALPYTTYALMWPVTIIVGAALLFISRLSITLNRDGITCTGFLSNKMPRHCAWNEFSQIRVAISPMLFGKLGQSRKLVFIHRFGRQYVLSLKTLLIDPVFVGVGHDLSLEEALKRFVGSVEVLSDEEIEKIPALVGLARMSKEVVHVLCATIGVTILLLLLAFIPKSIHLLDSLFEAALYWVFFLGTVAMACWYMQNIKRKWIMVILALILSYMTALLSVPIACGIPYLFGEQEQIVFRISEENDETQQWTATTDAGLTFAIRVHQEDRVFKGVGTERLMTLYRWEPGSLNALPDSEYSALFRIPPRRRNSIEPDESIQQDEKPGVEQDA
ncbi:MAG: hypothetical protein LBQ75_04155 [Zoogloeaceae bacterium]|nr:hypothetical protein [Zoogloeaceae bacterium]